MAALQGIYETAGEEERAAIARIFAAQAAAVQSAATTAGVEPTITFFGPEDPRRRPHPQQAHASYPPIFAPGYGGQMALEDRAQFGGGADPLGGVTAGPRTGAGGTIPMDAAFAAGAFRPGRGTSSKGGRAGNPRGQLALTAPHFSPQTSHGGHAHGPVYQGSYAHQTALGRERRDAAMDARSMAAALATRGGRPR